MIEIPLTMDKVALVDDDDYEIVRPHRWIALWTGRGWYAVTRIGGALVYMHRYILGAQAGQVVDHANGDGLDNRRCIIRIVTPRENSYNRRPVGRYKGITRLPSGGWKAQIWAGGKKLYLGTYAEEIEAAKAYDAAATAHFGEFAWLNFPTGAPA